MVRAVLDLNGVSANIPKLAFPLEFPNIEDDPGTAA